MSQQKLTLDLKEYLDDQFQGVDKRFDKVEKSIDSLKKNNYGLWVAILVIGIILLVHFGETSGGLLKMLFGRL